MTSKREDYRRTGENAARKFLAKAMDAVEMESLKGKAITFDYPRSNYEHVPLRYIRRIARVDDARDFGTDPMDADAAERDPHLRRIGKLVLMFDLRDKRYKTYYRGAMRNIRVATDDEILEVCPPAPGPCHVVLVHGRKVRKIGDQDVRLDEAEAGRWMDHYNNLMRSTRWRAAVIRPGSLGPLPTSGSQHLEQ